MAICCNRREVWTEHPHTSHCIVFHSTHFNVARGIGSRCLARITSCHHAFGSAFDLILFDPLLCTLHSLSRLPFPSLVLHLSCGFDEKSHAYFREWGVRHFGREQSPHRAKMVTPNRSGSSPWRGLHNLLSRSNVATVRADPHLLGVRQEPRCKSAPFQELVQMQPPHQNTWCRDPCWPPARWSEKCCQHPTQLQHTIWTSSCASSC